MNIAAIVIIAVIVILTIPKRPLSKWEEVQKYLDECEDERNN